MAKKELEMAASDGALTTGYNWEADAGKGLEDVQASDLSMPIWKLGQSNSPETKRMDPAYILGAAEGRWIDSLRRTVCDRFIFVPVKYMTRYIEWKPRLSGGGLVKDWGLDDSVLQHCNGDEVGRYTRRDNDNEVFPTPTWYGLVMATIELKGDQEESTPQPALQAVLSFTGTQAKVSRKWLNGATSLSLPRGNGSMFTPPLYYCAYKVGSIGQSNEHGSWAIPTVDRFGLTGELFPEVINRAKEFAELVSRKDFSSPVAGQDDVAAVNPSVQNRIDDDKIPF
jgi:hypothetical protein